MLRHMAELPVEGLICDLCTVFVRVGASHFMTDENTTSKVVYI